jgi:hypothetical protein
MEVALDTDLIVRVSVGMLCIRAALTGLVLRGHIKQGALTLLQLASTCQTIWNTLLEAGLIFEARARIALSHLPPVDIHMRPSKLQFDRPFVDAFYLRKRVITLTMGLCVLAPKIRPCLQRVRSFKTLRKTVAKIGNLDRSGSVESIDLEGARLTLTSNVSNMTVAGIADTQVFGFRVGSPIQPRFLVERPRALAVHEVIRLDTDSATPILQRMHIARAPHRVLRMYPNAYNAAYCGVLMVAGENTNGLTATLSIWDLDKDEVFRDVPLPTNFVPDGMVFAQHVTWTGEHIFDVWWSSTLNIADSAMSVVSDIYRFASASYMIGTDTELVTTGREMEHYKLLKVLNYAHAALSDVMPVLTAHPIGLSQSLQFYETDVHGSQRWHEIISSNQLVDAAVNIRADVIFALYHHQGASC